MGVNRPRINLAFTQENYDYIRLMAGVSCMDMTSYVNKIIEQHRVANAEKYAAAQALKNGVSDNGKD